MHTAHASFGVEWVFATAPSENWPIWMRERVHARSLARMLARTRTRTHARAHANKHSHDPNLAHLHALEVEDLLLAGLVLKILHVLGQAAQHRAAARLRGGCVHV